ncbi:hypothetical protein Zmor_026074 [Zophobas morio]|uniref:Uncharacterized protein n=1 Tax=Zophobas morio TaxID=2755281 RepID=A0AA38M5Q2_9CUCU|nr:hypothetical protein Zmor_026074 [Zophobas morio]
MQPGLINVYLFTSTYCYLYCRTIIIIVTNSFFTKYAKIKENKINPPTLDFTFRLPDLYLRALRARRFDQPDAVLRPHSSLHLPVLPCAQAAFPGVLKGNIYKAALIPQKGKKRRKAVSSPAASPAAYDPNAAPAGAPQNFFPAARRTGHVTSPCTLYYTVNAYRRQFVVCT